MSAAETKCSENEYVGGEIWISLQIKAEKRIACRREADMGSRAEH